MLRVPKGCRGAAAHNRAVAAALAAPQVKEALRKLSLHCMYYASIHHTYVTGHAGTVQDVASVACASATAAVAHGSLQSRHVVDAVAAHAAAVDGVSLACIPDLSIAEAFVLVACARCAMPDPRCLDDQALRFALVWEQLSRLAAANQGVDAITGRATALRAYERLVNRGLIAPATKYVTLWMLCINSFFVLLTMLPCMLQASESCQLAGTRPHGAAGEPEGDPAGAVKASQRAAAAGDVADAARGGACQCTG